MKQIYTFILFVFFTAGLANAQTFNWNTYTAGSTSFSTTSNNVTMSSTISGGYISSGYPNGNSMSTVGATALGASSYVSIAVNWPNKTTTLTTSITFSTPVMGVSFYIYDIDYSSGKFDDKLTITATDNANNTVYPSINASGSSSVSGTQANVLEGNSNNSTFTNAPSTITFSGNTAVKTITLVYSAGSNSPSNPSIQMFGIGTITTSSSLPVTLLSFDAAKSGKDARISWEADKQVNFDHYELERSSTGTGSFEKLGTIASTNSASGKYTYTDYGVAQNMNIVYYRLKMVDRDGSYSYSKTAVLRFDAGGSVTVFPTAVTGGQPVNITLPAGSGNAYTVRIFNMNGQVVASQNQAGAGSLSFETSGFTKGMYVVSAANGQTAQSFKIMVQ